ncbi:endonuclease [Rhizobium leguminosarum]|uniref:endonuclease n=1 Tax=Rhizobium leguminosarum TaxID=384 RepID=UPI001030A949|nr:endonuclease [Rhizobium leguminosarum]TAX26551.1 endonuclease [Rhizobium leguminosarum]
MRRVDRSAVKGPASLLAPDKAGAKELVKARKFYSGLATAPKTSTRKKKTFAFSAYKEDDVRHALQELFHGKCAYCESRYDINAPVDIEHFRPKGGVEGTKHPGYWWLAAEWTNLLPSCIDCNRRRNQFTPTAFASLSSGLDQAIKNGLKKTGTGKETCFPIDAAGVRIVAEVAPGQLESAVAAELALLLDPCRSDPAVHLKFHIDRVSPLGIVYPAGSDQIVLPEWEGDDGDIGRIEDQARRAGVSVQGAVSIHTYGLNRLSLIQERTRVLRMLEFLGSLVFELSAVADSLETISATDLASEQILAWAVERLRSTVQRSLSEIRLMTRPEAPFSEMAKAWMEKFRLDASIMPALP